MRFLYIATLIFLFNTAFMPVLGAVHEQSHQAQEGVTQIHWSDDQTSAGLFQIVHDEHYAQLDSGNLEVHSADHHCHHSPVLGMVGCIATSIATDLKTYHAIESILSLDFFPARIEYPPRYA